MAKDDQNKTEKKPQGEESFSRPGFGGPALWFFLLFVPVVLLFVVMLTGRDDTPPPVQSQDNRAAATDRSADAVPEEESAQEEMRVQDYGVNRPLRNRGGEVRNRNRQGYEKARRGVRSHQNIEAFCEFDLWVGQNISDDIMLQVQEEQRPYRILLPDEAYTMDHNPARINFDVDNQGVIQRVWCG